MKKLSILSIALMVILTGCGAGVTETMSCSYENVSGTLTTRITYSVDHIEDEVKKVKVTYDYHTDTINDTDGDGNNDIDGVGTGTDGTTSDTQLDDDGIVDGIVGSAIDSIINGVTGVILDVSGLRDRHAMVQNTYGNISGFSVQNTNDITDNNYHVTYVIDYDAISDQDLTTLNLSRDIDSLRNNYVSQGFTCK